MASVYISIGPRKPRREADMAEIEPKRGRPSEYTAAIAAEICGRLANGESLREICASDDMPGKSTVFNWLAAHKEFVDQYARAREAQVEHWADEIVEIADDGTNDWIERQNSDGSTYEAVNSDHINRSRLRVDARKWLMSKLAPKKYGDKITQEVTGANGAPLVPVINLTGRT